MAALWNHPKLRSEGSGGLAGGSGTGKEVEKEVDDGSRLSPGLSCRSRCMSSSWWRGSITCMAAALSTWT